MNIKTSPKDINPILFSRYIEGIYPSKEKLSEFLKSGRKLSIYIGIDPTGPKLHLGHSTNFLLLKQFQKIGHRIIFLIGDFTARIGDPTGKLGTRKPLGQKEILRNCQGYKRQAGKILNFNSRVNPVEIKFNGRWLSKLTLEEIIKLMAKTTVGQMIKRDMFQKRIKESKEIFLNEFLYPLLQGYDSVAMKVDIETGGNDQTFNMMVGRELVKDYLGREKIVLTTKLLINPKTQKKLMSKSEGNFVALDDPPEQMFGKIMALPDEVILPIFSLCTEIDDKEIETLEKALKEKKLNPKEAKNRLAKEIVSIYYGVEKAMEVSKEFNRIFSEKQLPSKMPTVSITEKELNILELLFKTKLVHSKSEAKRVLLQGGVEINQIQKKDWQELIKINEGMIIKVGKRRFVKIV